MSNTASTEDARAHDSVLKYCGRDFSRGEITWMCRLIDENPQLNRARLSRRVCRQLGWVKPDGKLKEMSCRVAMLRMHRDGILELPPPRNGNANGRHRLLTGPYAYWIWLKFDRRMIKNTLSIAHLVPYPPNSNASLALMIVQLELLH